ncbi:MAG: DUF4255 domain-containing protein [Anaerolineales bacterium]|nr:DUF4255 domain-containing protein [Anaerolineales bacterium]MCB9434489.1 DUF4255 domain-containing protein [Ardenticatenaceae bacterium]
MATYQAATAVCQAIIDLLTANTFDSGLEFDVYTTSKFKDPMGEGVSLFLYRILPNTILRTPPGRLVNGQRQRIQLPVDLHFMLTAWGKDASMQTQIMAWVMRVMADYPILPFGLLEATTTVPVFHPNEIVEISPADVSTEELLQLWENLTPNNYHLSVPYVARNIRLESELLEEVGKPVQTRTFDYTDEPAQP